MGLIYAEERFPRGLLIEMFAHSPMPAASLLGALTYATKFDEDPCLEINSGDEIVMKLENGTVRLEVIQKM